VTFLQPATFCNFYPSRFFGCGDFWRNTLTKVESGDEELDDTVSSSGESNPLNLDESADLPPPYTQYAAEREGVGDRTIQRRLRIAEKLDFEVRDYIRNTPLANDQRGLLRLTWLGNTEAQLAAARLIVEEGVPPRLAVERVQRMAARGDTPTLEGHDPFSPPKSSTCTRIFGRGFTQNKCALICISEHLTRVCG